MRSVLLTTVHDIALVLRAFDPGGCTSHCPLDEYVHEAIDVTSGMLNILKQHRSDNHHLIELMLSYKIARIMQDNFGDDVVLSDENVNHQIARACLNVHKSNVELHRMGSLR